jgi:hypothetical protein
MLAYGHSYQSLKRFSTASLEIAATIADNRLVTVKGAAF